MRIAVCVLAGMILAGPALAEAPSRVKGSSVVFSTGERPLPNVVRGIGGERIVAAPTFFYPPFVERREPLQQVYNFPESYSVRQSITYEVPTVMGIRNPSIGEPAIYVIENNRKSMRSSRKN